MNFFEPFHYEFMQHALIVGVVIAAMCAVLSCFLVLRGWSLMGDAISHAVLPGIVLAYIAGIPMAVGAFLSGFFCAISTGFIKQNSRIKEDTVMGVVFTGMFAIGLVIFSQTTSDLHLDHILFGSLLGISTNQIRETLILGSVVILVVVTLRCDLLLICFDEKQARVLAIPTKLLHYLLLCLLSLAIVISLKAVGIILVIAMLITPGATAYLWTDRFDRMIIIAVATTLVATTLGIIVSYHLDASPSACIVLTQALFFVVTFLFAPKYGIWANTKN
jgi:manganese/iron transport system permease protein